jgi:hypothetical protein
MKERPILMSGPMVRAILEGRKTQTRRVVTPQPKVGQAEPYEYRVAKIALMPPRANGECEEQWLARGDDLIGPLPRCPYGVPGGRLWVRETWLELDRDHYQEPGRPRDLLSDRYGKPRRNGVAYRADTDSEGDAIRAEYGYRWTPSIHMPRWASRLTLEITEVRVQRLQEISEEDAKAEGVIARGPGSPTLRPHQRDFRALWNDINSKRGYGWDSNPWVWAISFKRLAETQDPAQIRACLAV